MKRPNRKRYVNRAGIVTVNYTKSLEKYIDFLEAENKQFAISGVSKRYSEEDLDKAYDKGFRDGNQRDIE